MSEFRIAVKAFIVKDGKLLIIKRKPDNVHYADKWDIPGGRLEVGEDPRVGVKRETKEETNLMVDPLLPLRIEHFIRDDGQGITMIIFLCKPLTDDLVLSEEHEAYEWVDVSGVEKHPEWLIPTSNTFLKYDLNKFV